MAIRRFERQSKADPAVEASKVAKSYTCWDKPCTATIAKTSQGWVLFLADERYNGSTGLSFWDLTPEAAAAIGDHLKADWATDSAGREALIDLLNGGGCRLRV
jgi:hypothetical protein